MSTPADGTLRQERAELALLGLSALPDCWVVFFDADLRFVLAAGGGLERAGYLPGEVEGHQLADLLPPVRAQFWEPHLRAALRGECSTLEIVGPRDQRPYEVDVVPWRDASGASSGGIAFGRDITDRRRAERTQAELLAVFEGADAAITSTDLSGTITRWNRAATEIYGYAAEEAIGQPVTLLSVEDDGARVADSIARVSNGEQLQLAEHTHRRKDGTTVELWITLSPIRDRHGTVIAIGSIARDITKRKRAERQRELALEELEEAQSLARIGSWRQDATASEVMWSRQLYEIFERDPSDGPLAGEKLLSYVHPDDREAVRRATTGQDGGGPDFDLEFRIRTGRGSERIVHARGQGDPHRPGTFFGTCQDVTVERTAERTRAELLHTSARAEAANRAKSEFLARMSHELRTPLNSIIGFAQLLELDAVNDTQREYVDYIQRGGRHLLELINEVLDIASIESGGLAISPEPVALAPIVREAVALVSPLGGERNVTIDLDVSRIETDGHVLADRNRLGQVLLNLLSNAIKYNRDGGNVVIACTRHEEEHVRISITDTGIGIRREHLADLFEPFERLGAEQIGIEGTGLGLALSKGLIDAMGGAIAVESEPGTGTTFVVELAAAEHPQRGEAGTMAEDLAPDSRLPASRRSRVLYIEDNLSNLALIERILRRHSGVELISAMQGSLGLELARKHRPDLIVLDLHLPDMSGLEVLKRLQADTPDTPVVVVTADATRNQAETAHRLGASDYLTKPVDVREFLSAISGHLPGSPGARPMP